jgi:hypothetical protein
MGLDFAPLISSMNELIKMLAAILVLWDAKVAVVGLSVIAIANLWLRDALEAKWDPIIGIVVCCLVSLMPKMQCDIITGLLTGCLITGGYILIIDFVKKVITSALDTIFRLKNGNGNGNGGSNAVTTAIVDAIKGAPHASPNPNVKP